MVASVPLCLPLPFHNEENHHKAQILCFVNLSGTGSRGNGAQLSSSADNQASFSLSTAFVLQPPVSLNIDTTSLLNRLPAEVTHQAFFPWWELTISDASTF
jgi:hypothetical protein